MTTTDLPTRHFKPGDVVRIGNGYQAWTVKQVTDEGLVAQASNTKQSIAGKKEQVRTLDPNRAELLLRDGKPMTYTARAQYLGIDTQCCNTCHHQVMAAIAEDLDNDQA